ncbi:MAG TPA: cytochrome c oxidase subunit II [Stellaceae bacterium]|nr:cytochrome c oxidase subunit II [Stellaceae bacterium]
MARSQRWAATGRAMRALTLAGIASTAGGSIADAAVPHEWQIGFQPAATPVQARLEAFNNELTVIIVLITAFVLGLLLYTMWRFHHRRHPVPTHTSHNLPLEILWTLIPCVILVIIAVPSFKLMYYMARVPKDAMTVKITGHQWYWTYAYPSEGGLSFDSNIVQEANLKPGQPRLLTVDNPLVVPVDTNIKIEVTSTDVMHDWFVPSFGVQEYAIIGRINTSWFNVERPGIYRGQCDQLCGINHAFMPIEVKAVTKDAFQRWLVTAKKEFAQDNSGTAAVRVAAAAGSPAGGPPAAAGN